MLRSFTAAVAALIATIIVAPLVIVVAVFRSHSPSIDRLIRLWASIIIRGAGLRVSVEGAGLIDPDQRYIFIANHSSYFDIPCLFVTVPQPLRFMAKQSLFRIPLFGHGLRASGFIPIDRKDRSKAKSSLDLAGERIRKGNSIVIFPEEHRSHTREMRPFQRGAFLLAMKAELPIVPVAINGTFDAFPPGRWRIRSGPVVVRIGRPVDTTSYSVRKKEELMSLVRDEIVAMQAG